MTTTKNRKVAWLLLFTFLTYVIGIPVFVRTCLKTNLSEASITKPILVCANSSGVVKKSCCSTPKTPKPAVTEANACLGEYFQPSECCKVTYNLKQNVHKYIVEHKVKVKEIKVLREAHKTQVVYLPIPHKKLLAHAPKTKHVKDKTFLEYFPLRL